MGSTGDSTAVQKLNVVDRTNDDFFFPKWESIFALLIEKDKDNIFRNVQ